MELLLTASRLSVQSLTFEYNPEGNTYLFSKLCANDGEGFISE